MAKCLTLEVDLSANFHPMHDFFVVNQGIILLIVNSCFTRCTWGLIFLSICKGLPGCFGALFSMSKYAIPCFRGVITFARMACTYFSNVKKCDKSRVQKYAQRCPFDRGGGGVGFKAIAHMETTHFNKGLRLVAQLGDLCIVHWLSF